MLHIVKEPCRLVPDAVLRAMFAARKSVFVDLLKWKIPVLDGRFEVDQFDDEHARYVILSESEGTHLASARLLPTTRPHSYLSKAKPPCPSDILRIGKLNSLIGDFSLREPKQAWEHFRRAYLTGHDPGGQDRYRSVFKAAINVHYDLHDLPPLRIKAIPFNNERVRFLSREDRDRLIAAYSPHIQPIIAMLAFQGPRIQTALQIQWGVDGIGMKERSIRLNHSKNAVIKSVPMHPRVFDVLHPIWEKRGQPTQGHVFLNRFGKPYSDTRKSNIPGGNPIKNQHATACKRAGIEDFTVHDWRHHWASHCVMAGIDLVTIMNMGGWKSLRMVQRYSSVSVDHMRESMSKLD